MKPTPLFHRAELLMDIVGFCITVAVLTALALEYFDVLVP